MFVLTNAFAAGLVFAVLHSAAPAPAPGPGAGNGHRKFMIGGQSPPAFRPPSPDVASPNVLSLTRKSGSVSAAYLQSLRKGNQVNGIYGFTPLTSVEGGQVFLAGIEFGTESFQAVVDTGSSDTWLAETGFRCVNVTGAPQAESYCAFGSSYNISKTFKQIPNENFNISYADGEFLTGIVGTERVTLAGITVKNQQVGVVNFAAWFGDGISSGLVGLAFPILTSAFSGTDPTLDSLATQVIYNPIFTNMYGEGHVAPVFSLAIDRGTSGGVMAIGGLPPVLFSPVFASAPFQLVTIFPGLKSTGPIKGIPQYQFYTITTNGFSYQGSEETHWSHGNWPSPVGKPTDPSQVQVIVDSGTTLIYIPTGIANAVNALFIPPAIYSNVAGAYVVDCSAKAPKFGVMVGKQTFYINAQDMILGAGTGSCISGVNDAGVGGLSILGDVFLKNVLAVFDVGASEMRFAAREFY